MGAFDCLIAARCAALSDARLIPAALYEATIAHRVWHECLGIVRPCFLKPPCRSYTARGEEQRKPHPLWAKGQGEGKGCQVLDLIFLTAFWVVTLIDLRRSLPPSPSIAARIAGLAWIEVTMSSVTDSADF